jgi:hypothetical protein
MTNTYFAADGNCGSAEGLVIIDTSDWTESEWDVILSAPDEDRARIAREISSLANDGQLVLPGLEQI